MDDHNVELWDAAWDWRAVAQAIDEANLVIVEGFQLFPQTADTFTYQPIRTAEYVGFIRGYCTLKDKRLVVQMPAYKVAIRDDVFAPIAAGRPTVPKHSRDALKHVLYYALRVKNERTARIPENGK